MFKRIHSLQNTFSGIAGEARVAAELVRCGLRAAKPYWTDDEVDLIVLHKDGRQVIPIPIQVKSVQFLGTASRSSSDHRFLSGLRKKYVAQNPVLCLAIYRPDTDAIWFIDGSENIRNVYEQDAQSAGRTCFDDLGDDDDVRIRMREKDDDFDREWGIPRGDAAWLPARIRRVVEGELNHQRLVRQLEALWINPDETPQT